MVSAAIVEIERAGAEAWPEVALADAQYWNEEDIDEVVANNHVRVLIPRDSSSLETPRPGVAAGGTRGCATCSPQRPASS